MRSRLIGDRAFYKSVLVLLIPIVIQQFISSFVSLLDNVMVGSLGREAISAASIANQVMMVFNLAIFGGLSGASIFGAQFFGKGDMDGMRHTFRFKMYFAVLCSAAAVAVYALNGEAFISAFLEGESNGGNLAETLREGCGYLEVMLWGLPPFALVQVYAGSRGNQGANVRGDLRDPGEPRGQLDPDLRPAGRAGDGRAGRRHCHGHLPVPGADDCHRPLPPAYGPVSVP